MTMLLNLPITTAVTAQKTTPLQVEVEPLSANFQFVFTYGSSGTSADAYVQTSFDGGTTWCDVINFHATTSSLTYIYNLSALTVVTSKATPSDGTLTANTSVDGLFGNLWRVKYTTTGTYATSTSLRVDMVPHGGRMTSLT